MVGSIEGARSLTYQVLARKWRPQVFDAVVGQDPVTRTLRNALASGRVAHAYLFTGPRGVGKTTTARLLAKALACTARTGTEACGVCPSCLDFTSGASVDVMEIDAASNTSVDDIRTLRENVKYSPARGRFKVYIVDEVHMLSGAAFNAFLKTLEEPPPHVVFILATTDPKKIRATVLSRCQRFDFRPIPPELLTASLTRILEEERVPFEPGALPLLIRAAEGSLRDALSLLDTAIAYGEGKLDEAGVARLLGSSSPVHLRGFVGALLAGDRAAALQAVDRAAPPGEDLGPLCPEAGGMSPRPLLSRGAPAAAPDASDDPAAARIAGARGLRQQRPAGRRGASHRGGRRRHGGHRARAARARRAPSTRRVRSRVGAGRHRGHEAQGGAGLGAPARHPGARGERRAHAGAPGQRVPPGDAERSQQQGADQRGRPAPRGVGAAIRARCQ